MQVSKKNSSKIANGTNTNTNTNTNTSNTSINVNAKGTKSGSPLSQQQHHHQEDVCGVMTFGKSNQSSNYSSIGGRDIDNYGKK